MDNRGVIAHASDTFRCLLCWHEIDPAISDRHILIAYEQDGHPLTTKDGPIRLIVPGDERELRYLRGLASLRVLDRKNRSSEKEIED
jgi:hypothetical protein